MIIYSKYLVPKGFIGITLFPFIVLKHSIKRTSKTLINHEKIHLKQQLELSIIFFYLWYVVEFLYRWAIHKNRQLAYKHISFEREAYANENNLDYLKSRPLWRFLIYL
ncbi:hypothetical protein EJA19_09185 [Mangrovimonas spongiae]|uniref:DUF4157 domain-containing protein n=1 Tax=Mangrovimonas spongiae TaxID=2494697 RepID=A0A3R9MFC2_9FLAO|nr:hypothetical protein EJA19_09185 [Mangrovimonas spongiae]